MTDPSQPPGGPDRLVSREVHHGTVAVHGERLPVHRTAAGSHTVTDDVRTAAGEACGQALPIAERRRFRADTCRACHGPLTMPGRRTQRAVTVAPPGGPVFTLRFDLPLQRCPACGLDQLPVRAAHDIPRALRELFAAAVTPDDAPS